MSRIVRGQEHWSAEEAARFLAGGPPPNTQRKEQPPIESKRGQGGTARTNQRVQRTERDGIRFDSRTEARRYEELCADPGVRHIDCHPFVTLPGGIRWCLDFLVHPVSGAPWFEDVKGMEPGTDFRRMRQLFDASHPLAPLRVMLWDRGAKVFRPI